MRNGCFPPKRQTDNSTKASQVAAFQRHGRLVGGIFDLRVNHAKDEGHNIVAYGANARRERQIGEDAGGKDGQRPALLKGAIEQGEEQIEQDDARHEPPCAIITQMAGAVDEAEEIEDKHHERMLRVGIGKGAVEHEVAYGYKHRPDVPVARVELAEAVAVELPDTTHSAIGLLLGHQPIARQEHKEGDTHLAVLSNAADKREARNVPFAIETIVNIEEVMRQQQQQRNAF